MITIISKETDLAGKIRAMVDIGDEVIMLKFHQEVSDEEVISEAENYIAKKTELSVIDNQKEIERIDTEINILQDKKIELINTIGDKNDEIENPSAIG